jgi:hypothetical protein
VLTWKLVDADDADAPDVDTPSGNAALGAVNEAPVVA